MAKDQIINEIRRTADENGGVPLGVERFLESTGIKQSDWYGKYWARWGDAVTEAGYAPNKLQGAYEEEWVLDKFIGLIRDLGKFPVAGEIRLRAKQDIEFPSHTVFGRVGKKAVIARKIVEICQNRLGYEDVIAICDPIAEKNSEKDTKNCEVINDEYVYLMKSGRHYKIGRSNAPGRREYELGVQLPEPIKSIHTIRTDDPVDIEAYWHKRFATKRLNGEWFDLSRVDIAAFCRRKFM